MRPHVSSRRRRPGSRPSRTPGSRRPARPCGRLAAGHPFLGKVLRCRRRRTSPAGCGSRPPSCVALRHPGPEVGPAGAVLEHADALDRHLVAGRRLVTKSPLWAGSIRKTTRPREVVEGPRKTAYSGGRRLALGAVLRCRLARCRGIAHHVRVVGDRRPQRAARCPRSRGSAGPSRARTRPTIGIPSPSGSTVVRSPRARPRLAPR